MVKFFNEVNKITMSEIFMIKELQSEGVFKDFQKALDKVKQIIEWSDVDVEARKKRGDMKINDLGDGKFSFESYTRKVYMKYDNVWKILIGLSEGSQNIQVSLNKNYQKWLEQSIFISNFVNSALSNVKGKEGNFNVDISTGKITFGSRVILKNIYERYGFNALEENKKMLMALQNILHDGAILAQNEQARSVFSAWVSRLHEDNQKRDTDLIKISADMKETIDTVLDRDQKNIGPNLDMQTVTITKDIINSEQLQSAEKTLEDLLEKQWISNMINVRIEQHGNALIIDFDALKNYQEWEIKNKNPLKKTRYTFKYLDKNNYSLTGNSNP